MKKASYILVIFTTALASCGAREQQQGGRLSNFPVIEVGERNIVGYKYLPASIEGVENIEIRPRVEGFIQEIFVDEGQQVNKGQLLFRLEIQSLREEANAARSAIDVAEAQVKAAQVEVDKLVPLVKDGIISEVQLETAKANLAATKSQLVQATSSYRSIRQNVNYRDIASPVNGVVGRINYRQGSLVGRAELDPLTVVSNIQSVYAYFAMNEKDYFQFLDETPGQDLAQKIRNFPGITLVLANDEEYKDKGKIQTTTGQIDPETGAISFRAIFPNPNRYLTNGNSGQIKIPIVYRQALIIPSLSTYETQGVTHVYKLEPDSTLRASSISLLGTVDKVMVVEAGLREGDRIVAEGVSNARNGLKVIPFLQPLDSVINSFSKVFKQ